MAIKDLQRHIPLEKSWIIRMGVLDLIHGRSQISIFLESTPNLSDDLLALKQAVKVWPTNQTVDVGESGTLIRFLQFTSWKLNLKKEFRAKGTLKNRTINNNPAIIELNQKELLRFDGGTSQWASAKALLGDKHRISKPPHLLGITYEAIDHWNTQISQNLDWQPKLDRTIYRQAKYFLQLFKNSKTNFKPIQAEDYCFARALNLITQEEGLDRWPQLQNHESNRIIEMEKELDNFINGREIQSKDHRVIQAIAILAKKQDKKVIFRHPQSVSKTWPLFWEFLESV